MEMNWMSLTYSAASLSMQEWSLTKQPLANEEEIMCDVT